MDNFIHNAKKEGNFAVAELKKETFVRGNWDDKEKRFREDYYKLVYEYEVNNRKYKYKVVSTLDSHEKELCLYYRENDPKRAKAKNQLIQSRAIKFIGVLLKLTPIPLFIVICRIISKLLGY